jgi:hypothetical protein
MTDHTMTCDDYEELLPRHLENELSTDELDRVERHLATCRRCWALRDELIDLARAAAELPTMTPARDLWTGIAERIETPVIALDTGEHAIPQRPRRRSYRLAAAAAALVIGTAATTFGVVRGIYQRDSAIAAGAEVTDISPVSDPASYPVYGGGQTGILLVTDQLGSADAAYAREIAELRSALERRRPRLDSATVAILERNLAIIDSAIAQSKAALEKNPNSAMLSRQLDRALGRKVEVLRSAVVLPVSTE